MKKKNAPKSKTQANRKITGWWPIVVLSSAIAICLVTNLGVYIAEQIALNDATIDGKSYLEVSLNAEGKSAHELAQAYASEYDGEYLGEIFTYQAANWGGIRLTDRDILEDYFGANSLTDTIEQIIVISDNDDKVAISDKILEKMGYYTVIGEANQTLVLNNRQAQQLIEEIDSGRQEEYHNNDTAEDEEVFVPKAQTWTTEVLKFTDKKDAIEFIGSISKTNGRVYVQDLFGEIVAVHNDFDKAWRIIILVESIVMMVTAITVLIANAIGRLKKQ